MNRKNSYVLVPSGMANAYQIKAHTGLWQDISIIARHLLNQGWPSQRSEIAWTVALVSQPMPQYVAARDFFF